MTLKSVVDEKLGAILKEKLALFDLPLSKEKKAKLKASTRDLEESAVNKSFQENMIMTR